MDNYYLDKKIISILFNLTDDKRLDELNSMFTDIVLKANEELAKDFLKDKGVSDDEIEQFFVSENENEKIKDFLNTEEYLNQFLDIKNKFYKQIYDTYQPELSEEKKKLLEEYLLLINEENKQQINDINVMLQFLRTKEQLINENKISQDDFNQVVNEAVDALQSSN